MKSWYPSTQVHFERVHISNPKDAFKSGIAWDLVSYHATSPPASFDHLRNCSFDCAIFSFTVERRGQSVILANFFPVLLLLLLMFASALFPPSYPDRSIFCALLLFAGTVSNLSVAENIPSASNEPTYLGIFLTFSLIEMFIFCVYSTVLYRFSKWPNLKQHMKLLFGYRLELTFLQFLDLFFFSFMLASTLIAVFSLYQFLG